MNRISFLYSIRATCAVTNKARVFRVEAEDEVQAQHDATRDANRWAERAGVKRSNIVLETIGKRHA